MKRLSILNTSAAFKIVLVVLNILLAADAITARVIRSTVSGTSNFLIYSWILILVFSALQLYIIFAVKSLGKYVFVGLCCLPKFLFAILIEILCDLSLPAAPDYSINETELAVIICFFVLSALLFLAEISYCIINFVTQLKKENKGEDIAA